MAVSKRVRFEVLRRDEHTCRYCGGSAPDVKLTVDHVLPTALGGTDDPSNLVAACEDCNAGKSSIAPDQAIVADVDVRAAELAAALERASEKRRSETQMRIRTVADFDARWSAWKWGQDDSLVPRPSGWMQTLESWLDLGLTIEELTYYIAVAMNSKAAVENKWRYLCGCAWGELRRRQEMAYDELEDGGH